MKEDIRKEIWKLYNESNKGQKNWRVKTGQTDVLSRSDFLKSLINKANQNNKPIEK